MKSYQQAVMLVITLLLPMTGDCTTLSDPTRPANYFARTVIEEELPAELVDWKVTAIRIAPDRRSAVVNNTLVKEGDIVGNAMVLEIQPLAVVLDYDREKILVKLISHGVKKKFSNTD